MHKGWELPSYCFVFLAGNSPLPETQNSPKELTNIKSIIMKKHCIKCHKKKSLSEFGFHNISRLAANKICKDCVLESQNSKIKIKKQSKARPHYIYYITDGEHVKIGCSNNPLKRLKGLQTSNPRELKIIKTVMVAYYGHLAKASETKLHEYYKKYRVRGEWFTLDVLQIEKEPKTYLKEKHQFFKQ